jgi:hypothetical protein
VGKAGQVALAGRAGYDTASQVLGGGLAGFSVGAGAVLGPLHVDLAIVPYGQLGTPYRMSVGWEFAAGPRPLRAEPKVAAQAKPAPVEVMPKPLGPAPVVAEAPKPAFGSLKEAWDAAKAAEAAGSIDLARNDYRAAVEIEASNFEPWGRLAKFEYGQGNKAAAVPAFEQMQKLKPDPDFAKWLEDYKAEP